MTMKVLSAVLLLCKELFLAVIWLPQGQLEATFWVAASLA